MSEQHTQEHTVQNQTATAESHREDSTTRQTEQTLNEWLAAWEEKVESGAWRMERVTEIYDTTQPMDSTTGTPPLLSRIRERHEATSHGESRVKAESGKRDSTATSSTSTATENVKGEMQAAMEATGETRAESHEEKGSGKSLAWFFLNIILLTLVVVAIVIKHRSNNH